jgi:MoxR-like ATPase
MKRDLARGEVFQADEEEVELVNAALYLRRPLLITGKPGCGKSSLAYSVARELKLGPVLRWSITSSTKLSDGLYHYDALGRLHDTSVGKPQDIGEYIRLGPLGAALLPSQKPRVLLIDEIDKSDIDLPNDLLHVFEEGEFEIPELVRLSKEEKKVEVYYGEHSNTKVIIEEGRVYCYQFPFVVLTSNEEREFPPAFLRRCLRLEMKAPDKDKLSKIVEAHLGPEVFPGANQLIDDFVKKTESERRELATDQLLNAIYLVSRGIDSRDKKTLFDAVLRPLSNV